MEELPPEQSASKIITQELGVKANSIESLGMSIGGAVMKIETEKGIFVVKLIANKPPTPIAEEDVSDRVYGGRWTEFQPAYDAMKKANLPLPTVHATGYTEDDSQYFILMDYIVGESVREYMSEAATDEKLHFATGQTFGKLHTITREYQGWVSMETSYNTTWGEAFFSALHNQINEIADNDHLPNEMIIKLRTFSDKQKAYWVEPGSFVLSHLDGFQGIASKHGEDWSIDSVIDIEDHQFTDQRFVLCGHELAMEVEGSKLPKSFWAGYQSSKDIDPTFEQSRSLFKLYYLLVWLCVFRDESIGNIPNRDKKAENNIRMIKSLVST